MGKTGRAGSAKLGNWGCKAVPSRRRLFPSSRPPLAARVPAAERAALVAAEELVAPVGWWDRPEPLVIDDAAARLRARLLELDRARAEAEWGSRSAPSRRLGIARN